ncbi:enhancer of polycomb-like-domain-containing protein [Cyathus striatus]|nr:enhancer of polycomb-like-domain-containing protein [Cyathus striatus]
MPRNHHPGASTLRNRNRITNKTRLKIHHGNIEADALLIPDEDEEKHRLTNLVAGVDAEDANVSGIALLFSATSAIRVAEHHLQEVLTASHRTNVAANQPSRGDKPAPAVTPQAYIPTPDSTGIVDNYDELYPSNRWRDPTTFVYSSATVEETVKDGIAGGFTYYMDERDKEWLDKNNEEARGEGTSAQGALSTSNTRTSARSSKAKGKEPESSQPTIISEDEFELVMGVFEKATHDKTEFLHHSLETGMTFPAFSDYQDVFSVPLPPNMFSCFAVPSWVPPPNTLLKIARVVYPYWKERRLERNGHRIIPTLNFDEGDTPNESYICFRRREIKAVRKTRAQQTSSSEKLARLQAELSYPLELAKFLLTRETLKKETVEHAQAVWEKRLALVDLKRRYPGLGDKADEELLVEKERIVKKQEPAARLPLKIRTQDANLPPLRQEAPMRPRERLAMIREEVEATLAKQKDLAWEDQIDNTYQAPFIPYPSRLFKFIPPPDAPSWPSDSEDSEELSHRQARALRLRCGRGGRLHVDRRNYIPPPMSYKRRRHPGLVDSDDEDAMDVDDIDAEEIERRARLQERWRFDMDDGPVIGPQGTDEHDRILVDDYDSKYLRYAMTLLGDQDQQSLVTDAGVPGPASEGRSSVYVPFRLGMTQPNPRTAAFARAFHSSMAASSNHAPISLQTSPQNATPVAVSQPLKKMPPPNGVSQMRISSSMGMRPPSIPAISQNGTTRTSPPVPLPVPQHSPPNASSRAAIAMPHNGVVSIQPDNSSQPQDIAGNGVPSRPKSQNQPQVQVPNGFHLTPLSNHAAPGLAVTAPGYQQYQNTQQHAVSLQQMQNFKTALATIQQHQVQGQGQDLAALQQASLARGLPAYMHIGHNGTPVNMHMPNAANMNLKLPASRQMQWAGSGMPMQQRPNSVANGIEAQVLVSSPNQVHSVPVRSPSVNGTRQVRSTNGHIINANGQISMSPPHQHNSPSPMPASIAQSHSPPRLPMTPTLSMASPSMQHQQPLQSSQSAGY